MSGSEGRVGTYNEFTDNVLRRIKDFGYNAIQLMAIVELAYYTSFEYQSSPLPVTMITYIYHGIGTGFFGDYHEYFGDSEMLSIHSQYVYVKNINMFTIPLKANEMLHSLYPNIITIAENVSEMSGLCRPVSEGGIGFDYRLAMAIPDMWIKILKELRDDDWNIGNICWTLTNCRHMVSIIYYVF
ncbi:9375_t:CDS:2 [Gigaspora margarita]|uniref:9375_t:CDS:1 n=1 Tax=Gigaspora margarita TaxID=4874 RepID=A0ABN7UZ81_GIGMA|nr:9375_t:CDS:2 [Gigaspora margarita]